MRHWPALVAPALDADLRNRAIVGSNQEEAAGELFKAIAIALEALAQIAPVIPKVAIRFTMQSISSSAALGEQLARPISLPSKVKVLGPRTMRSRNGSRLVASTRVEPNKTGINIEPPLSRRYVALSAKR